MEVDLNLNAKIWDFISQFVCWEFCRNVHQLFPAESSGNNETDLLSFFRDMVIQMTTKQCESDITKYEVVAKFVEELNIASSYNDFVSVVQFSQTVKRICPELVEITDDLITTLEEKFKSCVRENSDLVKDVEFFTLVNTFSVEVCKRLPVPALVQVCESWQNRNKPNEVTVTPNSILNRLQRELACQEVPRILDLLECEDVYKCYVENVHDEEGLVTISLQELAQLLQECSYLLESLERNGELYDNQSSHSENGSSEENNRVRRTHALPDRRNSLFQYNYSLITTKKCSVALEDVVKKHGLQEPYYASYIERLSKDERSRKRAISRSDDEDFLESVPPAKSQTSPSKRYPIGQRHKRTFICATCGKSCSNRFNFRTHKCISVNSQDPDWEFSSDSEWTG